MATQDKKVVTIIGGGVPFVFLLACALVLGCTSKSQVGDGEDSGIIADGADTDAGDTDTDGGDTSAGDLDQRCNKSANSSGIYKPRGVFSSVITNGAVANQALQGGLIRCTWADIEPSPGVYDYSKIEERLALLPQGKKWSLGIHGGYASVDESDPDLYPDGSQRPVISLHMTPQWLVDGYNVPTFSMEFRHVTVHMPKYWDPVLQQRLGMLADEVGKHYNSDSGLSLVYVPQMTSNGLEGHFNGVPNETLLQAAGLDSDDPSGPEQFEAIWVAASVAATKAFSNAFADKAIAFEVHEVLGKSSIPISIMQTLKNDPELNGRAGVAMWWISGGTSYQADLLQALMDYEGDLYGQVIADSSQTDRFDEGDYSTVFLQAKELCMRYIEPWNQEFENHTYDDLLTDFNAYTEAFFD